MMMMFALLTQKVTQKEKRKKVENLTQITLPLFFLSYEFNSLVSLSKAVYNANHRLSRFTVLIDSIDEHLIPYNEIHDP